MEAVEKAVMVPQVWPCLCQAWRRSSHSQYRSVNKRTPLTGSSVVHMQSF